LASFSEVLSYLISKRIGHRNFKYRFVIFDIFKSINFIDYVCEKIDADLSKALFFVFDVLQLKEKLKRNDRWLTHFSNQQKLVRNIKPSAKQ
jgi:hypothetical protein